MSKKSLKRGKRVKEKKAKNLRRKSPKMMGKKSSKKEPKIKKKLTEKSEEQKKAKMTKDSGLGMLHIWRPPKSVIKQNLLSAEFFPRGAQNTSQTSRSDSENSATQLP